MIAPLTPENAIVAVLIATGGLWWFRMLVPAVRKMQTLPRIGIYAGIWLAYAILVLMVIQRTGG